jgi:hypothetical protein
VSSGADRPGPPPRDRPGLLTALGMTGLIVGGLLGLLPNPAGIVVSCTVVTGALIVMGYGFRAEERRNAPPPVVELDDLNPADHPVDEDSYEAL